jgi:type I restriction-modification system DNA methylase subunit
MPKKKRPPKSRLLEKAARGPQAFQVRYERIISRYVGEVADLNTEAARSHRFSQLLADLFSDVEAPIITEYLSGLETNISAQEAAKCRVSRGRPDALFGNIVVEFERSFPARLNEAKRQLQNYVGILRANTAYRDTYFIPIASDGLSFRVFAPKEEAASESGQDKESVALEEIENFDARTRAPINFYYWLDRYFCRRIQREPKADNFVQDFGLNSPAFRQASAAWSHEVQKIREHSDFKVIYDNWQKYLRIAYGTAVGDESLFIRHTFLATLAKLIAYIRLSGTAAAPAERETEEILQGTFFEKQGILNFLEEDFFSWVGRRPSLELTQKIVPRLVNHLFTYNLRELSEDVLKELYQSLVDPRDRHDLGEYYTPDWLATRMCEKLLSQSGEDAVLDPACGSGTFLYQTIQHKRKRLPPTRKTLEKILGNVVGIDIHPLAVIVAKINVLLALGDLFQKRGGPVSVQVYLANSIRHPSAQAVLGSGGQPAERVELNNQVVLIPSAALSDAASLDAAVRVSDEFAKANRAAGQLNRASFANYVSREAPGLAVYEHVVDMLFGLAETLHTFMRKPEDTIWAYILKNQYKPTFLKGKFDVVIGNPPWLSFRYVEKGEYQDFLKRLIVTECGLLEGAGHLITHLELGTLFFARCASLYLKHDGKIGFVLPRSIFTADQHDRLRKSATRGRITLTEVWDLEGVSPLFNVPAAVALGDVLSDATRKLPGLQFSGELNRKNASWAEAEPDLKIEKTTFHVVEQGKRSFLSTSREKISSRRSYYQPHFKEGATIVPRNFWFVEFKADPRLGIDSKQPLVATDPRAEEEAKKPYKGTHFEAPVEADFLYATLLSTDLLPFGHFDFRPIVLPLIEDSHGYHLLSVEQAQARGFLRLASWIERAQKTWREKRGEKADRMDIWQRLDQQRGITDQDPKAKYVVLYPMSATYMCSAVVERSEIRAKAGGQTLGLRNFLADYKTFCLETSNKHEAYYLSAILNSARIDELVKPMQSRGLWGPRDICKKVLELPIPEFKQDNKVQSQLATLAESCADRIKELIPTLSEAGSIGRARSAVRQALRSELAEIDSLVKQILK